MTSTSAPKPYFALRPGHPIMRELRRILLEQADYAHYQLTHGPDQDKAVHEARKAFKRIRGILRLVRDEMDVETFRRLNGLFRDAGRALSDVRTSAVLAETLEKIQERYPQQLNPEDMAGVLQQLQAHHAAVREAVVERQDLLQRVAEEVVQGRRMMASLDLKGQHFPAGGLRRVYARGRRSYRRSRHDPQVALLHDWRKRVKYLRYHVRVLSPVWPQVLDCVTQELVVLSEWLGLDHDLADLHRTLVEKPELGLRGEHAGQLVRLIEDYRADLERRSFETGARLYEEKPRDFVARMEGYWQIWVQSWD